MSTSRSFAAPWRRGGRDGSRRSAAGATCSATRPIRRRRRLHEPGHTRLRRLPRRPGAGARRVLRLPGVCRGLRLRLALEQELEATLDRFLDRPEGHNDRVTWVIYDEAGRRTEGTPEVRRPTVLDGRDLCPLAVDVATTIEG